MGAQTIAKPPSTLLRWREADTPHGVTKDTAMRAAKLLGLNETQLIHEALAFYLPRMLHQYDTTFDTLTSADLAAISQRVPQAEEGKAISSIIG